MSRNGSVFDLWSVKAGAALMFLFGPMQVPLLALMGIVALDIVLGTAVAIGRREWDWDHGVRRVTRKFLLLAAAVMTARLLEISLGLHADSALAILRWMIGYLAFHEAVSVTGHIEALGGPPLQSKLRDRIEGLLRRQEGQTPQEGQ
jgi:phage-related holin